MGAFLGRLLPFSRFGAGGLIHYHDRRVPISRAEDVLTEFIVMRIHRLGRIAALLRMMRLQFLAVLLDEEISWLEALIDGIERVSPWCYQDYDPTLQHLPHLPGCVWV